MRELLADADEAVICLIFADAHPHALGVESAHRQGVSARQFSKFRSVFS